jgi:2-amino-4-hydroxy-6-hydroxymethyldihydropteridine diphosphokinase
LGSNKSWGAKSPRELLGLAREDLAPILADLRVSRLRETAPLYGEDQPPFLNCAVCGCFSAADPERAPLTLLAALQAVEARYGRDRSGERRWGERSLDIDILLFGDRVFEKEGLIIPHPRLNERRFALEPLVELLPEARSPRTGEPYREVLAKLGR